MSLIQQDGKLINVSNIVMFLVKTKCYTEKENFHIRTAHRDIIEVFYSPTNAQVIALKTILKFTLK